MNRALLALAVWICHQHSVLANDDGSDDDDENEESGDTGSWVSEGGFMVYVVIMLCSFWALAVVVEEYFVPALSKSHPVRPIIFWETPELLLWSSS